MGPTQQCWEMLLTHVVVILHTGQDIRYFHLDIWVQSFHRCRCAQHGLKPMHDHTSPALKAKGAKRKVQATTQCNAAHVSLEICDTVTSQLHYSAKNSQHACCTHATFVDIQKLCT